MKTQDSTILTLKNDVIFKAVYGRDTEESKFVLTALLNHILNREQDPIVSLEYKNPFLLRERPSEKESILDILVKTQKGELIDIEMQMCSYEYLVNRLIYYHGGLLRGALKKGEPYDKMVKTITICIVDDTMFPGTESFLSNFFFMEEQTYLRLSDITKICVIELPKVNREKKPIEELTPLELCLEYLRSADERGSEYLDALIRLGGKELKMTQQILEEITADEILRQKALAREKYAHDVATYQHLWDEAKNEAKKMLKEVKDLQEEVIKQQEEAIKQQEEAIKQQKEAMKQQEEVMKQREESEKLMEEARQQKSDLTRRQNELNQKLEAKYREGRREEKLNLAKSMKRDGLPAEKIAAYTGLPEEEIRAI